MEFDGIEESRFAHDPVFESGAGGSVSTADDLLAVCRTMLNRGEFDSRRILSRPAIELMTTDQTNAEQKARSPFIPGFWESRGWGFGLSIITRRDDLANVPGRDGWDRGYGTSWHVDPTGHLVGILLTQRLAESAVTPAISSDSWTTTYGAIAG